MKIRHLLTGAILAFGLTAASSILSLAAVPTGRMEKVNDSKITGWAYDKDMPNTAVSVRISITDAETGEEVFSQKVSAGEYREDLKDKGDGCHGFTLAMDWSALEDGYYEINGYSGDRALTRTLTYTNGDPEAAKEEESQKQDGGLIPLGVFKTTGYCPCSRCSGGWGRHTSTGAVASASRTIAVDPAVIPYGSQIMINGVVYTAEDRGGGVRGNHIDIFYNTHAESLQHGVQNTEVYLVAAS